jgi:ERCC4-related helicase
VQVLQDASSKHPGNLRCIVFVQQRITTHILEYYLQTNDCPIIRGLKTACIYATNTPATQQYRVTKSQADERIQAFADGRVTVLLSTSFAEEGLDVQVWLFVYRCNKVFMRESELTRLG